MSDLELRSRFTFPHNRTLPNLLWSREIFRKLKLPLIPAVEAVTGQDELLSAIGFLATEYSATKFLVRLNQDFYKNPPALITLPAPLSDFAYQYQKDCALLDAFVGIGPVNKGFWQTLQEQGAVVELALSPVQSKILAIAQLLPNGPAWQLLDLSQRCYQEENSRYSPEVVAMDLGQQTELVKMAGTIAMELSQLQLFGKVQVEFLQVWELGKLVNYPQRIVISALA